MKLTIKTFFNKNNFIKNISKKCRVKKTISEKRQKKKKKKKEKKQQEDKEKKTKRFDNNKRTLRRSQ